MKILFVLFRMIPISLYLLAGWLLFDAVGGWNGIIGLMLMLTALNMENSLK